MAHNIVSDVLLSAKNVCAERSYRQLFSNISFDVCAGDVCRIAGPNGSGKSTLLKIVAGITTDFEGDLYWQRKPIQQVRYDYQQSVMYLGHQKAVKLSLSPVENLHWFLSLYPSRSDITIEQALLKVGLKNFQNTLCGQLSAGQQQRVALARLLLSSAKLWLLDEPFTAIDKQGVVDIEAMISQFVQQGGAVMVITHHDLCLSMPMHTLELGA